MVGFILGLGDRHSSNILIDTATAELVHIDLGISFDHGRTLQTPEVVPFRLTRDIVDGLGVTGVEGMMRSAAEITMRVLRDSTEALLTLLQVFVTSPLYSWAKDPTRDPTRDAARASASSPRAASTGAHDGQTNLESERALLRIQDKLAGRVAGSMEAYSVEGQVRALIDEARHPENLCRMFGGWAPWL